MSYERYAKEISDQYLHNDQEAERLLKFFFKRVAQDLAAGGRIRFNGFGSFKRIKRPPRTYRNPRTKQIETRPTKKDVEFSPSEKLLEKI